MTDHDILAEMRIDELTAERDSALARVKVLESALDGGLVALAGAGICTPEETFKRAPSGSLGSAIRNLKDERDAAIAELKYLAQKCSAASSFWRHGNVVPKSVWESLCEAQLDAESIINTHNSGPDKPVSPGNDPL